MSAACATAASAKKAKAPAKDCLNVIDSPLFRKSSPLTRSNERGSTGATTWAITTVLCRRSVVDAQRSSSLGALKHNQKSSTVFTWGNVAVCNYRAGNLSTGG